jgi:hypothetical protein
MLTKIWRAFLDLIRRNRAERELDEELQFHLRNQIEQNVERRMNPEEARYAARRLFGGVEQVKQRCRDLRGVNLIESALQDIQFGFRQLWRNPGFTAVAIITLALGIGANTAIFSVVNAVLLQPLPYPNPGRLVYISEFWPREQPAHRVATPDFANWLEHNRVFEALAAYGGDRMADLAGSGEPEPIQAVNVSGDFFTVLGVQPFLGRAFLPQEERPGGRSVVILGYSVWRGRFGANAGIIGQTVTVDDQSDTVVGVLPASFRFPDNEDDPQLFIPDVVAAAANWHSPQFFRLQDVIARLKPGVKLAGAKSQLTAMVLRTKG